MVSKTTFNYKKNSSQMFSVNISTERIFTASNNLANNKRLRTRTSSAHKAAAAQ